MGFYENLSAISFHKHHFTKRISHHFISHKPFFMLNKYIYNITISHKHTLVNRYYFHQGSQIVLYAWSHYLVFDYCNNDTWEHINLSLFLRSLSFIRYFQHISQLLIHVVCTPHSGLDSLCAYKVSIILRNQLMVWKPFHCIGIVIIKSRFNIINHFVDRGPWWETYAPS